MTRMARCTIVLVAILVCLVPTVAFANMANPVQPGDPVGEPTGDLKSIAIAEETLQLDLRPLAVDQPALIDATYQVRNGGATTTTNLLFVAPALTKTGAGVWLDGNALPFQQTRTAALPPSWQPPATTPGIGGPDLRYSTPRPGGLVFAITVPPGAHQVHVHYTARAMAYSDGSPTRYWQIGYVLAPARQWASFGQLAVSVKLPQGWLAASRPGLTRSGDELTGTFSGVPADALALTVQSPPPPIQQHGPTVAVAGFLLAILVGLLGGLVLVRAKLRSLWLFPAALLAGLAWGVATVSAETVLPTVPDAQRAWTYGYGQGGTSLGPGVLAFLAGVLLVQGCGWLVGRVVHQTTKPGRATRG